MLHERKFPERELNRRLNFIGQFWVPVAVITAAVTILTAGLLGVAPRTLWIGSLIISILASSYLFFITIFNFWVKQKNHL